MASARYGRPNEPVGLRVGLIDPSGPRIELVRLAPLDDLSELRRAFRVE